MEPNFEHFLDLYEPYINQFEKDEAIVYRDNSIFGFKDQNSFQYLVSLDFITFFIVGFHTKTINVGNERALQSHGRTILG